MWKKDRSRKRKNSSSDGDTCSPSVLTAAAAGLALTGALLFAGSDSPGCNDVSALNYSPQATNAIDPCSNFNNETLGPGGWCLGTNFERKQLPHTTCNIARRPYSDLLADPSLLESPEPIIFMNATDHMPARELWQRDHMLSTLTDSQLDAGHPQSLLAKQLELESHSVYDTSLADHLKAIRTDPELYVFSKVAQNSVFRQAAPIPPVLDEDEWTKVTLALGGSTSGMMFHAHDAAIASVVYGRKRWLYFDAVAQTDYKLRLSLEISNLDMLTTTYREDREFRNSWKNIGWECVQEAGELMYVPARLQHAVVNIGETVAMVYERCPAFGENVGADGNLAPTNGHPNCNMDLIEQQMAYHRNHPRRPSTKLKLGF